MRDPADAPERAEPEAIGVILAGGLGTRIGGAKAMVMLGGRPLISYPLAVLRRSLEKVVVIAKPDTALPELEGVERWAEPPEPRHPLIGIVHALAQAGGAPVLACAADLPFVTTEALEAILAAEPRGALAVVPACDGLLQPQLALYRPAALTPLRALTRRAELPSLRAAAREIGARVLELGDRTAFFNVNSPADLEQASAMLERG